ncbi:Subtilisin-like protease [Acorus calamus]|uniref:Subtilisin-like protease n=1 Tax=Acorus calamus TaxID=4465 RepID=A0AAV9D5A6_ACOCL|nr:Subtilisin-like protease [Acorus calamus]
MSCPHVAGIVGLLKALHPDWSPAAIRSAIMTSARMRDNMREPMKNASLAKATPFSYGAGHVRPNRAMDPGLVYDATTEDYLAFLCDNGYNSSQMASFAGSKHYACPKRRSSRLLSMNYPSITVPRLAKGHARVVRRVVKNVGGPGTYKAHVQALVGCR